MLVAQNSLGPVCPVPLTVRGINFVVMLNFANILFGATNRFLAKNLYVGRGVAKQIREVAVETLNGVRAVKEAYD